MQAWVPKRPLWVARRNAGVCADADACVGAGACVSLGACTAAGQHSSFGHWKPRNGCSAPAEGFHVVDLRTGKEKRKYLQLLREKY